MFLNYHFPLCVSKNEKDRRPKFSGGLMMQLVITSAKSSEESKAQLQSQ